MNKFIAKENDQGRTLLKFIERAFNDLPKSRVEKLLRKKDISINGKRTSDKKYIIQLNDEIIVYGLEKLETIKLPKAKKNFDVIFEDENILVVSKQINDAIHGDDNSLDNQVLNYLNYSNYETFLPTHIGRIDKVTSGIVLYAKNYESAKELNNKISFFDKTYACISDLKNKTILKAKIFHDEKQMKEVVSLKYGTPIETHFEIGNNNIVFAKIITGRKHQIRASLEFLGFPIKGDVKYGGPKDKRVFLHSYKLNLKKLEGNLEYLNNKEFIVDYNF